jgi:hypothetical protein
MCERECGNAAPMRPRSLRRKSQLLALLAVGAALSSAVPASAVVLDCTISTVLSPSNQYAAITEFTGANVTFAGSFNVTKPFPWVGNITFYQEFPLANVTISPTVFEMGEGEFANGTFAVNATLPAGSSYRDELRIYIGAQANFAGGKCGGGSASAWAYANEYYGTMTGAASPAGVTIGPETTRATVLVNISQATNFVPPPLVQAFVAVGGVSGINFTAPRLVNMSVSRPGHVAATFNLSIEWNHAAPGVYDVVVNVTSNAFGLVSPENRSAVDVVVRVIVERPLAALQVAGATAVGGTALAAVGFWLWRERRERRKSE